VTKRPEENDIPDMEAGMTTAERRRRRRRGAGLRVPSDNVPRRSGGHAAIPAGDDASLGVSIAYAFSPDSGPVHRSELHEAASAAAASMASDRAFADGEVDDDGLADDADGVEDAPDGIPDISADGGDEGFDAKTREMPALRLPSRAPARSASVSGEIDRAAASDAADPAASRDPAVVRASTVALSEDDLEELVDNDRARPARRAVTTPPMPPPERAVTAPGELRRPRTDEGIPAIARAATQPPIATAPSAVVELDDDDLEGEVVTPGDASDSGEILADELLEEVEAQAAQAVRLGRAAAVSVPEPIAAELSPRPAAAAAVRDVAAPIDRPSVPSLAGATAALVATPVAAPASPPPAPSHGAKPPPAPKKGSAARAAAVAAAVQPDAGSRKKKRGKPWFEEIFDEDYLRTLPFLTPQATQGEAQFVVDALGLSPGAQVLDLGCGYGRHAMELAARGYHVVGLDLSLPLLLRGADEAQRRGLSINFVHGDMRELDFDSQFDGAYCLFSTFGYFDDEANKKTAANLARALKPGARAVIEVLNRDYLIADLPTRVWWEGDGCVVLEEVDFNYFSSRISSNRSVVFDDGRQLEQEISIRAYALHELGKLLHAAGFRVLEVSGSMVTRGRFFGGQSRQIIAVAERRPKDATDSKG
jgi:SAM-dependent methyltransferase